MTRKKVSNFEVTVRRFFSVLTALILLVSATSAVAAPSQNANKEAAVASEKENNGKDSPNASDKSNNGKSELDHGNSNKGLNGQSDNKGNSASKGRKKASKKINDQRMVALNVVLKASATPDFFAQISELGTVVSTINEINSFTFRTEFGNLEDLRDFDEVKSVNEDAERRIIPVVSQTSADIGALTGGAGSWNLDMINVTEGTGNSTTRVVEQTGSGTYVAVIDTGLLKTWRSYFDESNIATEYGAAFGGGGGERGTVSRQPNKWELDQDSHGIHVTSTILGFKQATRTITGVAPDTKVIPIKVLGQNGSGWSSVVAAGITYVANLKAGPLASHPVIINMSLSGPTLDGMEQEAIDYAISVGVIVVASAGNSGEAGMGYPGAYAPVISVASAGWTGEWSDATWWRDSDVPENGAANAYISDFSSRAREGQQLDVAAPGSWIVGPYQTNGQLSWYFLGGTSMASPHVAGLAALMMQKNGSMSQSVVESKLKISVNAFSTSSAFVRPYIGIAEVSISWPMNSTGTGLVDAVKALSSVLVAP